MCRTNTSWTVSLKHVQGWSGGENRTSILSTSKKQSQHGTMEPIQLKCINLPDTPLALAFESWNTASRGSALLRGSGPTAGSHVTGSPMTEDLLSAQGWEAVAERSYESGVLANSSHLKKGLGDIFWPIWRRDDIQQKCLMSSYASQLQ